MTPSIAFVWASLGVILLLLVYASRRPGPYWRDRMDVDFGFDR